jgi:hypothetical protein
VVQIVVGMLLKYVNLGAGWRQRLFVLQDGVLRYYKVRLRYRHRSRQGGRRHDRRSVMSLNQLVSNSGSITKGTGCCEST